MLRRLHVLVLVLALCALAVPACGDDAPAGDDDAAPDAATADAATTPDGGDDPDAAPAGCLLDGHAAGDRYPVGDGCNACDCNADGTETCTERTCPPTGMGCTYDDVDHAYGERFDSTDGCNECVCAASGLACTRRVCEGALEEGAILLESLDEPCGDDELFTAQAVLDGLPYTSLTAPYRYETDGPLYPETLPDTVLTMRIFHDGGFAVCRIPNPGPGQEAIDLEIMLEWITADGAFDEGYHTYLRRNYRGFTDAWYVAAGAPHGSLHGTFDPACLDPNGISVDAAIDADGTASGGAYKLCETDIYLPIATFTIE